MTKPQGKSKPAKRGHGLTVSVAEVRTSDAQERLRRAYDLIVRAAARAKEKGKEGPHEDSR